MRRGSRQALLALAACSLAAALAGAACGRREGRPFACDCAFLTDYDDGSKVSIEVCVAVSEPSEPAARGCAQSGAPAPVERCDCRPLDPPTPCAPGACVTR